MKQETELKVKNLCDKYNSLMQDVVLTIQETLPDDDKFDFEENGFEDDSNNDIEAVDSESVYTVGGEKYDLEELSFWDAIKVIECINMAIKER